MAMASRLETVHFSIGLMPVVAVVLRRLTSASGNGDRAFVQSALSVIAFRHVGVCHTTSVTRHDCLSRLLQASTFNNVRVHRKVALIVAAGINVSVLQKWLVE
jgi:hypothetical protein